MSSILGIDHQINLRTGVKEYSISSWTNWKYDKGALGKSKYFVWGSGEGWSQISNSEGILWINI